MDVDVLGLEHVRQALRERHGVLITPNHPSHADPFVLLQAADRLGVPFYFMTAWQVFARLHRVGRRVLRQHGCFSVNREGHDLRAVRQAIRVLQEGPSPLVIFPEGEVYHLNDRVMPFRRGAMTAALLAARRSGRPVSVVPCGLKFQFVNDPMPELERAMGRLERAVGWQPAMQMPLARRIGRFAETLIAIKETEYLGASRGGRLQDRISTLISSILGRLEDRYQIATVRDTIPERVKHLRYRVIASVDAGIGAGIGAGGGAAPLPTRLPQQDLDDLFFVMQLYSYPVDYLAGDVPVERFAETLDKLEEDVFKLENAPLRGLQRAVAAFDEPLVVQPEAWKHETAGQLTDVLHGRVQSVVDRLNEQLALAPQARPLETPRPEPERLWLPAGAELADGVAA